MGHKYQILDFIDIKSGRVPRYFLSFLFIVKDIWDISLVRLSFDRDSFVNQESCRKKIPREI